MRFKKIIRHFEDGNVCVFGLRGRGKDLLMSNVVVRRDLEYVSNVDYGSKYIPYDYKNFDCGKNTYRNFITGDLNYYHFPYNDHTDLYISDAGVYFPSQYCSQLDRDYPYLPVFAGLSRHLGLSNFHANSQDLRRIWTKLKEQSDCFILCRRCFYVAGFVFQWITIYDKYESAECKQKPFSVQLPLFANREMRLRLQIERQQFEAAHGSIENRILFYRNRSSYDTRRFKVLLEEGNKSHAEG